MKTIGFPISMKENEKRRALLPEYLEDVKNVDKLYFEEGYGKVLGINGREYLDKGVNICSKEEIYELDIICNPKSSELFEYEYFREGQTLFGWIHAVQNRDITDLLVNKKMTGIAWEDMFKKGRHVFSRNNEIAAEAAIWHAFLCYGHFPYECSVAVIGRGNCARGAIRILEKMGAKATVYDRKTIQHLRDELGRYDVIVNAVLWDVFRKDRLIYRKDLKKMKKGAMIIDISCDEEMEIETSYPTTIKNPVYYVDGILHYAVDHTASLFWRAATESISKEIKNYVDDLVKENYNEVLEKATIIKNGKIIDDKIIKFQGR
jgi:N5-(carboxyethyl)ornithine synthase